jgi:hypothetical protein
MVKGPMPVLKLIRRKERHFPPQISASSHPLTPLTGQISTLNLTPAEKAQPGLTWWQLR